MKKIREVLLLCGITSSLLYAGTDLVAGTLYAGYSFIDQDFSELWAFESPVRQLLLPLVVMYGAVLLGFALGVWLSAGRSRALRATALMLVGDAIVGVVTPVFFPAPMHGVQPTFANTLHLPLTGVNVVFILLSIGFGAAAHRNWFRPYSIGTILILLAFGIIGGTAAPAIATNLPTPWAGLEERILIYAYLLWVAVLAIVLLRAENGSARRLNSATFNNKTLTPQNEAISDRTYMVAPTKLVDFSFRSSLMGERLSDSRPKYTTVGMYGSKN